MGCLFRAIRNLFVAALFLCLVGGAYVGNRTYEAFREAPWDQLLGIENHGNDTRLIDRLEREEQWRPVTVTAADGLRLRGTYIENEEYTAHTVVLLHGLYQNRGMCLPYIPMYKQLGYNILLVDLRGHGESEGRHTDWGLTETSDMAAWFAWLKEQDRAMQIGLHGVSLGAAMALLYAGEKDNVQPDFVIADSAYGNILSLGREKLLRWSGDERLLWGYTVLEPFFQGAMFIRTGKVLADIEPAHAARSIHVPILFLHGEADTLVPVQTAYALYDSCGSNDKHIWIFPASPHAAGIETDRAAYEEKVINFLEEHK